MSIITAMFTRRNLLASSALAAAAQSTNAQAPAGKFVVISSANGLIACTRAMRHIKGGGDTLEAVVQGVTMVEDDPEDNSVGLGGLPNENGVVELDASLMHGPTGRAGSVASVRNIKNVARLAKLVMEQTDHVMLVGQGALDFAKAWGIKEENLLTEKSRLAWMTWKQSQRDGGGRNNWTDGLDAPPKKAANMARLRPQFPNMDEETFAWAERMAAHPLTGTINCLGLNAKGEMSGVTTTSGLAWKLAGRVGDSPVIGAGVFVDQEVGAAGSTGRGEENIRICGAHTIVENMRHGMAPKDAILDALKRISKNYGHDLERIAQFDIQFYALRKDGTYAGGSMWSDGPGHDGKPGRKRFAVNTGDDSRLEDCVHLYERKK
jgi:N4-(beta-N-acetylglucosaminyl)-L-asparaginase